MLHGLCAIYPEIFWTMCIPHECKNWSSTLKPRQWPKGSALKIGRREVPGSIFDHPFQPSCSDFFVVFLLNSRKYKLESIIKTLKEVMLPAD